MERPLKNIPAHVLRALHRGIEKHERLQYNVFNINDDGDCLVCALGAMGDSSEEAVRQCVKYGLFLDGIEGYSPSATTKIGDMVEFQNNTFGGTPEERREFMLRLIVTELRFQGQSLIKKTNVEYQEVK